MSQWDICHWNHLRHPTIALSPVFFCNIFLPFFPTTTTKLYFSKSPRTSTTKSNGHCWSFSSGIATIFDIIDDFYLKWLLGCMYLAFLFYLLITKSQSLLLVLPHFPKGCIPGLLPTSGDTYFLGDLSYWDNDQLPIAVLMSCHNNHQHTAISFYLRVLVI